MAKKPPTSKCKNCGRRGWVAHDMMASAASACTECDSPYTTIETQYGSWYKLKPNRHPPKTP